MEASSQPGPKSKAAKKRAAKRRKNALQEVKLNSDSQGSPQDLIEKLNTALELAKSNNDKEKAQSIREKIWILQDVVAGMKSELSPEELESIAAVLRGQDSCLNEEEIEAPKHEVEVINGNHEKANEASIVEKIKYLEKQLRKLLKKQSQIEKLKERQQNGENLEKTQVEKIYRDKAVEDEIDGVEEELFILRRM